MKYISDFNSYKAQEINEGLKENILAGLLSLLGHYVSGQDVQKKIAHTKTYSETAAKSLIKQGWSLDSTSVDTLYSTLQQSKPDTQIVATRLTLDKDQFFESGKYTLTDGMKQSIDSTLEEIINSEGIIIKIEVESSTDKQGLSSRLQDELSARGFAPNNQGLSDARSGSVSDYLEQVGINDTIIQTTKLSEQGEGEVSQSARYVHVDFYYLIESEAVTPSEVDTDPKIKKTYYLSKERAPGKPIKVGGPGKKTVTLGPIKNKLKISDVRCAKW
jgi:outer membrane protein OmpA-like peptidoglycan-associated protein